MKISLQDWARRWKSRRFGRSKKRLDFKAACLSIGLATAWAAPAQAATVHLEVTPESTITEAYVGYYHLNNSSVNVLFLGTLQGGQTSHFDHDFPGVPTSAFEGFDDAYLVMGLYDEGGSQGVAFSFFDDSPITTDETWDSSVKGRTGHTEQNVVDGLLGTRPFSVSGFFNAHRSSRASPYGSEATMIFYSAATFGGTAIATIVPEPTTSVILVSAFGIVSLVRRRRS